MEIKITTQVNKVISDTVVNSAICIYVDEAGDNGVERVLDHTTYGFCNFDGRASTTRQRFLAKDKEEWDGHINFLNHIWSVYGIEAPCLVTDAVNEYYKKGGEENIEQSHSFQIDKIN